MDEPTLDDFDPFPIVRIAHIDIERPEPAWLIASLWGEQAVGFIGGTPKSCKTWLALELAVAVATGRPCLGRFQVRQPGPVLLYTAEDGAADVRRRVAAIARARKIDLARLAVGLITEPSVQLDRPGDQWRLRATLAKVKPRLLVLDPLVRLHRGDENSASDISTLLAFLRSLQREHGVAIAVVHHIRKAVSGGQPGQALRGSGDLHAWSDSNLFLLHRNDRLELHAEHRNHPAPDPVAIELATGPEHLVPSEIGVDAPSQGAHDLQHQVVEALAAAPMTRTALRDQLRVRNETLGQVLAQLEAAGVVHRADGRLTVPGSPP
jgi:hypothetical protein